MHSDDGEIRDAAQRAVRAFLDAPEHAALVEHWRATLGLSRADIEAGYLRYSLESLDTDNDIYASTAIHVAMWIEYQDPRSMHAPRQRVVLDELRRRRSATIADIGFGAPTRYLHDYVLPTPGVTAALFDKYPAAIEVGRSILSFGPQPAPGAVRFALHDMDADPPIAGCDAYLLLDAVEHARDPAGYLRATVSVAQPGALFLLHMPIGPLIASHSIAWHSNAEATRWLESAGLDVDRTDTILPNPEADHFARHEITSTDLFVVAHKR